MFFIHTGVFTSYTEHLFSYKIKQHLHIKEQ